MNAKDRFLLAISYKRVSVTQKMNNHGIISEIKCSIDFLCIDEIFMSHGDVRRK